MILYKEKGGRKNKMKENIKILCESGEVVNKNIDSELGFSIRKLLMENSVESVRELIKIFNDFGVELDNVRGVEFSKGEENG